MDGFRFPDIGASFLGGPLRRITRRWDLDLPICGNSVYKAKSHYGLMCSDIQMYWKIENS